MFFVILFVTLTPLQVFAKKSTAVTAHTAETQFDCNCCCCFRSGLLMSFLKIFRVVQFFAFSILSIAFCINNTPVLHRLSQTLYTRRGPVPASLKSCNTHQSWEPSLRDIFKKKHNASGESDWLLRIVINTILASHFDRYSLGNKELKIVSFGI